MQSEKFRGYVLWGHAILQQQGDVLQAERYAASGTITRDVSCCSSRCPRRSCTDRPRDNHGRRSHTASAMRSVALAPPYSQTRVAL